MNSMGRRLGAILVVAALIGAILPLAGPAGAVGTFDDDDGNTHEADIEAIAASGITKGCNPPDNTRYCPDDPVTRAQMASFLVRALHLAAASSGPFTDISGNTHEADINALYAEGITKGCNPPANDHYCPDDPVTRAQMASFLVRALDLASASSSPLTDISGNTHEANINALYAEGITKGCNPPANDHFCPDDPVTRAQLASFLVRALDLPTSRIPSTTTSTSTTLPSGGGACFTTVEDPPQPLDPPYTNNLGPTPGGLCDTNGDSTGFPWAAPTSHGVRYDPMKLDVTGGVLAVTTTGGLFEGSENTQTNALAVPLSPQISVQVETSIVDPPAGTGEFEQAGLWFGNGEDDYIKVVFMSIPTGSGYQVQARYEQDGVAEVTRNVNLAGLPNRIDLRLKANHGTLEAQAQYRFDGGSWQDVGSAISGLPNSLFTVDQAGTTTETFAGILTSDRGGPALVFDFDSFNVTGLPSDGGGGGPFMFTGVETQVSYKPTSMAWHGNKLYVLAASGVVHRYDVNSSGTLANHQSYARLPAPSGGVYTALGLAIEPGSSSTNPHVWVSTSITGGSNFLEGVANSSRVWRIPNLATGSGATAMITGLPRAFENHAINSIHFYDGQLYIAQGGNTGAGEANDSDSAFGSRPEQPLAAAWLRADVLSGWSPSNDGDCATAVDDGPPPSASKTIPFATCSVEIVATGLRNMYDFVKHSNNNFYGPDNGLGVTGTVPETHQPDCQGYIAQPEEDFEDYDPGPQPDRLHILDPGNYYGHPNPARNECVFFNGAFQSNLYGTTVNPLPNYTPAHQVLNVAQGSSPRSLNSIIEYNSAGTAFGGEFDGDLLITAFAGLQGLYHYDLAENCGSQQSAYNNGCLPKVDIDVTNEGILSDAYLGLTQINSGRLAVGDWNSRTNSTSHILILIPDD